MRTVSTTPVRSQNTRREITEPVVNRMKTLRIPRNAIETRMIPVPERFPSSVVAEFDVRLFQNSSNESNFRPSLVVVVDVAFDVVVDVVDPEGSLVPVAPVADILAYSLIR